VQFCCAIEREKEMSDKITFGTFGRYTEIPVDQMNPEQKKGYEYVVKERGEAPGPYKIILENPNLLQVLVPVGRYFQESHSSLSDAEREIVVNLINAKWHAAYSNYEHEMIGERAGLPPEKVQALIAGLHTSFDDPRQVVYDMTCTLIASRIVPQGLYERAVKLLGDTGLTDAGPSGGHWGRRPGEYGRLAFCITDGGTASPPEIGPQPARLMKVDLLP
jgi:4-carboxymuconolactone decarboxylase